MNSPEDTAWLSKETDDFLRLAILWPKWMTRLFHVLGVILSVGIIGGWSNENFVLVGFCGTGVYHALKKLNRYKQDIILIRNEQSRRRQGA